MFDVGILVIRVLFGVAIAAHGAQKLFGWFGGYGLKGTGGFFEGLGFRPGVAFAAALGRAGGLLSSFTGAAIIHSGSATFYRSLAAVMVVTFIGLAIVP